MNSVLDSDKIDLFGEKKMDASPSVSGQTMRTTVTKVTTSTEGALDKDRLIINKQSGSLTTANSSDGASSKSTSSNSSSIPSTSSTMNTVTDSRHTMSSSSNDTNDLSNRVATANTSANTAPSNASLHDPTDTVGPITKKPRSRPAPYTKPTSILLTNDRRSRGKKSITWQSDEKITSIRYIEIIDDERINVATNALFEVKRQMAQSATPATNPNKVQNAAIIDGIHKRPNGKTEYDKTQEYSVWRPLILIDFTPTLPSPGWNSIERSAQADREKYVLGAIDLPGKPSTLDEPEYETTATKEEGSDIKIIPLENPDGMYTEYANMYNSEIVNGVRLPSDSPPAIVQNITPFIAQQPQSQLMPNQFQQQLVQATSQNPFSFQEMSAQFQQPLPFQQQQISMPFPNNSPAQLQPQQLQQPPQQQQQSSSITGPIMPWLNYPFNSVSENSHAHLFRRPAT